MTMILFYPIMHDPTLYICSSHLLSPLSVANPQTNKKVCTYHSDSFWSRYALKIVSALVYIQFPLICQSFSSPRLPVLSPHDFPPTTFLAILQETSLASHEKLDFRMYKRAVGYTVRIILTCFTQF
jgi:hypothetical protein